MWTARRLQWLKPFNMCWAEQITYSMTQVPMEIELWLVSGGGRVRR
jgi:hypothetical protein